MRWRPRFTLRLVVLLVALCGVGIWLWSSPVVRAWWLLREGRCQEAALEAARALEGPRGRGLLARSAGGIAGEPLHPVPVRRGALRILGCLQDQAGVGRLLLRAAMGGVADSAEVEETAGAQLVRWTGDGSDAMPRLAPSPELWPGFDIYLEHGRPRWVGRPELLRALGEEGVDLLPGILERVTADPATEPEWFRRDRVCEVLLALEVEPDQVLPSLVGALEQGGVVHWNDPLLRCLVRFGKGQPEVTRALREQLETGSDLAQVSVALALLCLEPQDQEVLDRLVQELRVGWIEVPPLSSESLWRQAWAGVGPRALRPLRHLLHGESATGQLLALRALACMGEAARPLMPGIEQVALAETHHRVRGLTGEQCMVLPIEAVRTLGELGPVASGSLPLLREILATGTPCQQRAALLALWQVGMPAHELIPALREVLDPARTVAMPVVDPLTCPCSSHLHMSPGIFLRLRAARVLGAMGPAAGEGAGWLRACLDLEGEGWSIHRPALLVALARVDPRGAETRRRLLEALEDPDPLVRLAGATGLAHVGQPSAVWGPTLVALLLKEVTLDQARRAVGEDLGLQDPEEVLASHLLRLEVK